MRVPFFAAVFLTLALALPAWGSTLLHRYTFEGASAADAVGDLDGTPFGDADFTTADSAEGSWAAVFDGDDDYIAFGTTAFDASAFSVAMWVKADDLSTVQGLLSNKSGGAAPGFSLFFATTGKIYNETGNGSASDSAWTAENIMEAGQWRHLAFTVDRAGGEGRIYYQGTDATADSSILTDFAWEGGWRLAIFTDDRYDFGGLLDDVQIYQGVLAPEEVAYLAQHPGAVIPEPATLWTTLALAGLWGLRARWRARRLASGGA